MSGLWLHLTGTVRLLEEIFYVLLVIRMVASFLPPRTTGLWERVVRFCFGLTEPLVAPIRKRVPLVGALDLSPLIALFLVDIAGYILIQILSWLAGL